MLDVRNLGVSYDGMPAVTGVSLRVDSGEIVSIVGANGAGKTTILNAICGVLSGVRGDVVYEGKTIRGLAPHAIVARGIVQVPEGRMIFATLSVAENLCVGAHQHSPFVLARRPGRALEKLFPALLDKLDLPGSALSGGEAQMLAIARGLESQPRMLLLDEPSLGLSPKATRQMFDLIDRLRDQGLTVLLVEQNVRQTLLLSDRAYVLESGRIVMQGQAAELLNDARLIDRYLGVGVGEKVGNGNGM